MSYVCGVCGATGKAEKKQAKKGAALAPKISRGLGSGLAVAGTRFCPVLQKIEGGQQHDGQHHINENSNHHVCCLKRELLPD